MKKPSTSSLCPVTPFPFMYFFIYNLFLKPDLSFEIYIVETESSFFKSRIETYL